MNVVPNIQHPLDIGMKFSGMGISSLAIWSASFPFFSITRRKLSNFELVRIPSEAQHYLKQFYRLVSHLFRLFSGITKRNVEIKSWRSVSIFSVIKPSTPFLTSQNFPANATISSHKILPFPAIIRAY